MTEKHADDFLPDDTDGFVDVSSQEDENDLTIILPDDVTESLAAEATEDAPSAETDEVFVLLPDGDDSQIPMVDTEEVTEDMASGEYDGPRLATAYESASQVELRRDNPLEPVTETYDPYGEPTEEADFVDEPTEPMSAGDLDDFASAVADDMLVSPDDETEVDHDPVLFDDTMAEAYEDEEYYDTGRSRRGSPFAKMALVLAALIAIAATGVYFFPDEIEQRLGVDLSFIRDYLPSTGGEVATTDGSVDPVSGSDPGDPGTDPPVSVGVVPPPDVQLAFKIKYKQAIELGFGEVPR